MACIAVWLAQDAGERQILGWVLLVGWAIVIYLSLTSQVERCQKCNADSGRYEDQLGVTTFKRRKCRYCGTIYEVNSHLK
jgi:hypothetical protein